MFFQLSLPASLSAPEALHTLESLSIGAPGTLTVEVLTREQRAATDQRAHCRLGGRERPGATRMAVSKAASQPLTFTP